VKNLKRTGHILSSIMSERYNLLKGALSAKIGRWNWVWQGRPVMVMPVDLNLEQAIGVSFDQVYEFDLTLAPAQKAYNAAVRGDFVPARLQYLDAKEKGIKTGVMFHFARNQKRNEFRIENGPNLAVFRDHRITSLAKSNIEITDKDGKFYVLEASQDVSDSSWDVLVGEKERRVQQSIELRVRKAIVQEQSKEKKEPNQREFYIFDTGTDPYRLSIMLTIQDRNIVASDLLGYIQRLEDISGLVMSSLPSVKVRDPVIESRFRRSRFFSSPDQMAQTLHVTPAFLGRFGAQLLMSFSGLDLDRILSRSEEDMWKAFAEAFGFEKVVWSSAAMRESWSQRFLRFTSYLVYPLRLLNMHFKSLDAERESQYLIGTLLNLKREHSPESMLDGFTQMLDTAYPEQLMTALLTLADPAKVSRRVILSTQAKGRVSEKEKEAFSRMNNMVFAGGPPMPSPSRYARAKEKLAGFYLDKPQGAQNRVQILRVDVVSVEVPTTLQFLQGGDVGAEWSPNDAGVQQRHIQMSLSVKGGSMERPLKMFLKVEEAGRLKLGKLELAEKVLEVPANVGTGQRAGVVSYDVYLTGPLSPLKGYMLDRAIEAGGKFQVTVSVSIDGIEWGDARSFEFRLENGRLMSPS
jgi:hypothetical protein